MNETLRPYIELTNFIGEIMGEHTEVVLHDLTDIENSIVAIKNNLSGRTIGGPASNLVLQIMQSRELQNESYLANYQAYDTKGNPLRSSTLLIKDKAQKLVGMLCVNTNNASIIEARNLLDSLIKINEYSLSSTQKVTETLSTDTEELTLESISRVIQSTGITPERMSQKEKLSVIQQLDRMGIFLIKGSIPKLANILTMSESSMYRYLRESRKKKQTISKTICILKIMMSTCCQNSLQYYLKWKLPLLPI